MIRIGLLSDTHGHWDERIRTHFHACDEVWHAGDLGPLPQNLSDLIPQPFFAVYGNIDDQDSRNFFPASQLLKRENLRIGLMHIAGYPGKYTQQARQFILENKPDLFICGHSHILKVMRCKDSGHLHINPGAAGISGFHQVRTLIRFNLDKRTIRDLEVIHLGKRVRASSNILHRPD